MRISTKNTDAKQIKFNHEINYYTKHSIYWFIDFVVVVVVGL